MAISMSDEKQENIHLELQIKLKMKVKDVFFGCVSYHLFIYGLHAPNDIVYTQPILKHFNDHI
jgi:hypothetical protein